MTPKAREKCRQPNRGQPPWEERLGLPEGGDSVPPGFLSGGLFSGSILTEIRAVKRILQKMDKSAVLTVVIAQAMDFLVKPIIPTMSHP